jgi:hypothetical protein
VGGCGGPVPAMAPFPVPGRSSRYGEIWLSGITNMVKTPVIYRLSPIYHFWHFWCDFCNFCVFFSFFRIFWVHLFFAFLMCLIMKIFGVHFFDFLWFLLFFVHIFCFLLPPIVKVDISDIAIISVIPDMVKSIISGITNTPQKTYGIAQ